MQQRRFLVNIPAIACVVAVSSATGATGAHAQNASFLCNDALTTGANAHFQLGFAAGERAAIKINPPANAFPLTIQFVDLFYGQSGDNNASVESIAFYEANGVDASDNPGFPGTELGRTSAPVIDATDQLNQVALDTPVTIATAGPFWVSLELVRAGDPAGAPGPATDGATTRPGVDAIFTGGVWVEAADLGVAGNWVIRIEADTAAAQNDAACRLQASGEGEGEGAVGEGEGEGEGGAGEGEGEGAVGALTITSVNPSTGVAGSDVTVTVTGDGFSAGTTVRVGSATCGALTLQNAGALLCTVPGTLPAGVYDVIAQTGAETFVFPSGFTVTAAPAGGCNCGVTDIGDASAAVAALGMSLVIRRRRSVRR